MSSIDRTGTMDNHDAQALNQFEIESLLQALEEDSNSTNILSSSPEEDSLAYFGIHDSFTLTQYDILKVVHDDISDRDKLDIDISQQEIDRAWEAFDSSWEHDLASSCSSKGPQRSGVRRGRHSDTAPSTSVTLTVMTKTHDGASRERGTSGFIEIDRSVGSSSSTASAA